MLRTRLLSYLLVMLVFTHGCGGGSSGSSPQAAGNPGPTPIDNVGGENEEDNELTPENMGLEYRGITTTAVVGKGFELAPANMALVGRIFVDSTEYSWQPVTQIPPGKGEDTVEDDFGTGNAKISYEKNEGDTGFFQAVFTDFDIGDAVLNGTIYQSFINRVSEEAVYPIVSGVLSFENYRFESDEGSGVIIQGTLVSDSQQANVLVANILFTFLPSAHQLKLEDFRIELDVGYLPSGSTVWTTELSGSVLDSELGKVRVSTVDPLQIFLIERILMTG